MNKQSFRWGLIGPGRIAHAFAEAIKVVDGAELYALASRDYHRGRAFAQQYDTPQVYSTYEKLAQDPDVDAIYIATPHRFHHEQARLCLEAGKPVLCEKSLTVNAQETQDLISLAKEKNLFLMEALWTRYLPIYQQVRQWLDAGAIGEVKHLNSSFGFRINRDLDDRLLNPDLAGGALLDVGIYPIAMSQWVCGDPVSFSAHGYLGETGVDEYVAVNLQYANSCVSQFITNFVTTTRNDLTIYGSAGHIRVHPMFWGGTKATLVTEGQELTVHKPFRASGFEYQIEEAMRCLQAGLRESPTMTHAHSLANMTLMDNIRQRIGMRYPFEPALGA